MSKNHVTQDAIRFGITWCRPIPSGSAVERLRAHASAAEQKVLELFSTGMQTVQGGPVW